MSYTKNILGLVTSVLVSLTAHAAELRCAGSDGGTPFVNITQDVKARQSLIPTHGMIKDFLFQEKQNQLVYRNLNNQLRSRPLDKNGKNDKLLNYANAKLSRVVDENSSKVLSAQATYYLDASVPGDSWYYYAGPSQVIRHLFWNQDTIYSLENSWSGYGRHYFQFLSHNSRGSLRHYCYTQLGLGKNLGIAQQSNFPYIYFHTFKPGLLGNKFVVYRIAVNRVGYDHPCPVEEVTSYSESQIGSIKAFYQLNIDGVDALAFHLADPKRTLFWDKPGECAYYNLKGRTPIFLSSKQPIFASWANGQGLTLHNLKDQTEVSFFKKISVPSFGRENIWLSDDGRKVFTALEPRKDEEGRLIVKTELDH